MYGLLAGSTALDAMASPYIESLIMSMTMEALCIWAIGPVLAMAYRRDEVIGIMEGLAPWHRVLGGIIAVVFYSDLMAVIPR